MPRTRPTPPVQAAENVADLLTCAVCMEPFDGEIHQPKLLPCHHTFCQDCLVNLTTADNHIQCPSCRVRTALNSPPPGGVAKLQTNFYLTHMKAFVDGSGGAEKKTKGCRKHSNQRLDSFCRTCEVPVCADCCVTEHKSATGHVTQTLKAVVAEETEMLRVEIAAAHQVVLGNLSKRRKYDTELSCLQSARDQTLSDIDGTFDRYVERLNQRRADLKEQVAGTFTQRKEKLAQDLDDLKKQETSLLGMMEQCEDAITSGNILDLMAYKLKLSGRNRDIRSDHEVVTEENNFIRFDAESDVDFWSVVRDAGSLAVTDPLPSAVKITDSTPIASLFTTLMLSVEDSRGRHLENYPMSVDISDPHSDVIPTMIQPRSHGRYEVTFRPKKSGMHRLRVKFLDQCVKNGTFSLDVLSNDPVAKIGSKGGGTGELEYPRAVAVDSDNSVYVVDTGNSRIQKFDNFGRQVSEFSIAQEDELSSCGLAINAQQGLLVCPEVCLQDADLSEGSALLVYSLDGLLLNRFTYKGVLKRALSVAINSHGHMIVADYELNTIFVFDRHGRLLRKFGETGSGPGQFNRPTFVCVDESDTIIISDGDNHRIQVFDRGGKFQYQFGRQGRGKGDFNLPFGVTADYHGNILVVDGGNRRVQIFKQGGEFLSCVESLGDPLNAPRGIAVTTDGHFLLADRDNHCVKKYKYLHCTPL